MFTSVAGDGYGMSSTRVEARRFGDGRKSVGVEGWATGRTMFERDWRCWFGYIKGCGAEYTWTYDENTEDTIEPSNMKHENEYSALPCPVEGWLRIPLEEELELARPYCFQKR
jgi:hypothetical protein